MDDLYKLEILSLTQKIVQEIVNHTGVNDKTLAEFVISLHEECKSLADFKSKLQEMGAGFPDSFVENMDRLIVSMHPKYKKKKKKSKKRAMDETVMTEDEKKKRMFPGLSKPDVDKDVLMAEVDDMMAQFEGKAREQPAPKRQRVASPPPRRRSPSPARGRQMLDDRPIMFKIYNGRVTGLKDFGAFVALEGIQGRAEGMLSHTRIFLT